MRTRKLSISLSLIIFNLSFFIHSDAQIISTVAGNGVVGSSGDGGPAKAAELYGPNAVTMDHSGNLYLVDQLNARICMISSTGIITTFAGNGIVGYSGDGGPATAAEFNQPTVVIFDSLQNFYVVDYSNNRVRKINTSGIISTIAGNGIGGYSGNGGPATAAELDEPTCILIDNHANLYIADAINNAIREVTTSGEITLFAGNHTAGFSGDGGNAMLAELNDPVRLSFDDQWNMYVADARNSRVREINTSGIITTVAGNGTASFTGDGGQATLAEINTPFGVCVDRSGNIYIADTYNNRIRKVNTAGIISTLTGNGTAAYSGDGGIATSAEINYPTEVSVDDNNNLYVDDFNNNRLREIIYDTSEISCYSWKQKASLTALGGRSSAAGFSIGHFGYIGTGSSTSGNVNDFWRWNQDSNTWTAIANYAGAGKYGVTGFTIAGNGYCCFGWTGSSCATDLWEYDTTSNSWTQKASFPGPARYGAFAFVLGTKAYIGCGEPNGLPYDEDVWVYDAVADTWTQVANFGGGERTGMCAFSLNGYGYAGCGCDTGTTFNDLWRYDSSSNTWTIVASMPGGGGNSPIAFVIDTLAYVGTGNSTTEHNRDFYSYSSTTNTWMPIAALPGVSRSSAVGFSIRNSGYIGTGSDSVGDHLPDFWEYSPCNDTTIVTLINQVKTKSEEINVYPNPNDGIFTIALSHAELVSASQTSIEIYNILGEKVLTEALRFSQGENMIDLTGQSGGVYLYRVIEEDGSLVGEGKVIVVRMDPFGKK